MPISQAEGYFENLWYRFLEKLMLFLWGLKKNSKKKFFQCQAKTNPNFVVKLAGRSNHSLVTVYLMNHIFQTLNT